MRTSGCRTTGTGRCCGVTFTRSPLGPAVSGFDLGGRICRERGVGQHHELGQAPGRSCVRVVEGGGAIPMAWMARVPLMPQRSLVGVGDRDRIIGIGVIGQPSYCSFTSRGRGRGFRWVSFRCGRRPPVPTPCAVFAQRVADQEELDAVGVGGGGALLQPAQTTCAWE